MKTTCSKPTSMWHLLGQTTATGKKVIVQYLPNQGVKYKELSRPCGSCSGCRIRRRMDIALRLEHEAYFHDNAWFVTATYDDENLPEGGTLVHDHISQFIRALRKKLAPQKLRFFGVGEYGGDFGRAHYHLIIFGPDFPDKKLEYTKPDKRFYSNELIQLLGGTHGSNGMRHFSSELLSSVWKKGIINFSYVSPATMQYVAKFHVEKVTGEKAEEHYKYEDPETGEIYELEPEQSRFSRNPGLGRQWIEKFWKDIYPEGVYHDRNGAQFAPPKYYDRWLEENHPEIYEELKAKREDSINAESRLQKRLDAIELNRKAQMQNGSLPRGSHR